MNGGSTLNAMRPVIVFALIGVIFMFLAPYVLQLFTIINLTTAIALAVLALSLALVWGFGGYLVFWAGGIFWAGGLCLYHWGDQLWGVHMGNPCCHPGVGRICSTLRIFCLLWTGIRCLPRGDHVNGYADILFVDPAYLRARV